MTKDGRRVREGSGDIAPDSHPGRNPPGGTPVDTPDRAAGAAGRGPGGLLRRRLALVAAFAVTLSCGSADGPAGPGDSSESTVRLPIRIHLISSRLPLLDATLTETDAVSLIDRVNQVWAQADIVWELDSVIREPAEAEDEFELALQGTAPITAELLVAVVPRGRLLAGRWDVFLVADLASAAGAPGIYFPGVPMVLSSQVDPAGLGDPGRILAHELGHSLTLEHVLCTGAGNLMSPGCDAADRTRLTASQIARARAQALTGMPTAR